MTMRKLPITLWGCGLVLVLGALGACGGEGAGMGGSSVEAAERVAARFFEVVKAKNFAAVATMFSQPESGDQAIDQLQINQSKLGDLQSYELRKTDVNTVFSGRRFTLRYVTRYPEFTATETLILFESVSEPGIKIEVYNVSSEGLRR